MSFVPFAVGLATLASSAGPPETQPERASHPLVTASEALYERKFTEPCDEVIKLALSAPGLADEDRGRLHLLAAMRAIDTGDDAAANEAIARALRVDPLVAPPPYASPRVLELLQKARSEGSPRERMEGEGGGGRDASPEPVPRLLLEVVGQLYLKAQVEGATIVLEVARSSTPLATAERVQVALWQGVLKMEMTDETGARVAFREALVADRNAELPSNLPWKTRHLFDEVKLSLPATDASPMTVVSVSVAPPPATNIFLVEGPRRSGLYVGGAGLTLIAGGVVAGSVALVAYEDVRRASANGDWTTYTQSRQTGKIAINVADGLFGLGAAVLGAGALLLWHGPPGSVQIGASGGQERVLVVVGGHF